MLSNKRKERKKNCHRKTHIKLYSAAGIKLKKMIKTPSLVANSFYIFLLLLLLLRRKYSFSITCRVQHALACVREWTNEPCAKDCGECKNWKIVVVAFIAILTLYQCCKTEILKWYCTLTEKVLFRIKWYFTHTYVHNW